MWLHMWLHVWLKCVAVCLDMKRHCHSPVGNDFSSDHQAWLRLDINLTLTWQRDFVMLKGAVGILLSNLFDQTR